MAERLLKLDMSDAFVCDTCKTEPAAIGTTDAVESGDGTWAESAPRRGCLKHPVQPIVRFANGRVISFEAYQQGQK